jgi:hypothetical protein
MALWLGFLTVQLLINQRSAWILWSSGTNLCDGVNCLIIAYFASISPISYQVAKFVVRALFSDRTERAVYQVQVFSVAAYRYPYS